MRGIAGLGRVRVSFVDIVRGIHRMSVVINVSDLDVEIWGES